MDAGGWVPVTSSSLEQLVRIKSFYIRLEEFATNIVLIIQENVFAPVQALLQRRPPFA